MNTKQIRLYDGNLKKEYPNLGKLIAKKSLGGKALLQRDYGKAQDCTITSLSFLFGVDKYDDIEKIAEKRGYNGETCGTNPLSIRNIMKDCCKQFGIRATCYSSYGKGVAYNYEKVKQIINSGAYLLLNLWKDGRDYYKNHTVTIIGYVEYEHARFFEVYDNWTSTPSFVDYDKLSTISSINWLKKG